MPYAVPSSSTSPTMTVLPSSPVTSSRVESQRPLRHHQRSHSTDSLASNSSSMSAGFIFVQPASPEPKTTTISTGELSKPSASHLSFSAAGSSSFASPSNLHASTSQLNSATSPVISPRRIKLFGFTPADGGEEEDGPSSQDESSRNNEEAFLSSSSSPASSGTEGLGVLARTRLQHSGRSTSFAFGDTSGHGGVSDFPLSTMSSSSSFPSSTSSSTGIHSIPTNSVIPLVPLNFRPNHLKSASEVGSTGSTSSTHAKSIKGAFPGRSKTAMVRKKSGELVRSSLKTNMSGLGSDLIPAKPKSAPSTPTCPKYVHFDTQLEHVKHFLSQQRPAAVSRSGSPVETETEDEPDSFPFPAMASAQAGQLTLKLPNFPTRVNHLNDQDAYLESLEMATDGKNLKGVVRVKNLSFEKWVAVRFTLDHWQTVSEVSAEHQESMGQESDRFGFHIKLQDLLSKIEEKTMFVAVRCSIAGREVWDNNGGQNYKVEFEKKIHEPASSAAAAGGATGRSATSSSVATGPGAPPGGKRQTWSVTTAGQAADRMADLRRELNRLVQDDLDNTPLHVNTRTFTEGSPSALSNRYDFGNSLKMFTGERRGSIQPISIAAASSNMPAPLASPSLFGGQHGLTTQIVGGMPATIYHESMAAPLPSPTPTGTSMSTKMLTSPIPAKKELLPDFGAPSTHANSTPNYGSKQFQPIYSTNGYGSHQQQQPRPPSPPDEQELAKLYNGYGSASPLDMPGRARFHSFPGGGSSGGNHSVSSSSGTSSPVVSQQHSVGGTGHQSPSIPINSMGGPFGMYNALLPPNFRDQYMNYSSGGSRPRRRDSPFVSPAISPAPSPPGMSPQSTSPPRSKSPSQTIVVGASPMASGGGMSGIYSPGDMDLWSPASSVDTTTSTGSNGSASHTYSPLSTESSVEGSPQQEVSMLYNGSSGSTPRPSGPADFSSFLDRYCFHQSNLASPGTRDLYGTTPLASDYSGNISSSNNTTPASANNVTSSSTGISRGRQGKVAPPQLIPGFGGIASNTSALAAASFASALNSHHHHQHQYFGSSCSSSASASGASTPSREVDTQLFTPTTPTGHPPKIGAPTIVS